MNKILSSAFALCLLVLGTQKSHSQTLVTLSDFSNLSGQGATFSGSWRGGSPAANQYVQNTGFGTITTVNGGNPQDDGDFLVEPVSTLNIGSLNQISLTLRVDSGNTDASLKVILFDDQLTSIAATFSLSGLTTGSFTTLQSTLSSNIGFHRNLVSAWQISGGAGVATNNTRVSLDNVAVVPEPSTYALLGVAGVSAVIFARRKRQAA